MNCPICHGIATEEAKSGDFSAVFCQRCGSFKVTGSLAAVLQQWKPRDRRRAALSAYIRHKNKQGIERVGLDTSQSLDQLVSGHLHTSFATKMRRAMEQYDKITPQPGHVVELNTDDDYPLFDAASPKEAEFLVETLEAQGLIEFVEQDHGHRVSAAGWSFLEPLAGGIPNAAFVAMSFDDELIPAFDQGIAPAVRQCGFDDVRMDRIHHSENINDRILADIRRSQFVVADFTHHRNGVYFEAGFALGLGKPVVWTCRSDHFTHDQVHFDTRPYNHIVWQTIEELRQKLTDRIRAVIPNARQA